MLGKEVFSGGLHPSRGRITCSSNYIVEVTTFGILVRSLTSNPPYPNLLSNL